MAEEPSEDLSMDDILSSIRNILMEDNAVQQSTPQPEVKAEPVAPVAPITPVAPIAPVAPVAQDVPVITAPEEDLNLDDLPEMDEEDIGLLSSEDEVFDLSPSMIIEKTEEKPAAVAQTASAEPEISEDDILNLSSLIPSEPTIVAPQQKPALQEEKTPDVPTSVPSFEPSIPSPRMNAPLASEVLSEEEFSPENEPEVSLDDIMNLSSLIEKDTPAPSEPKETTINFSDELDSGNDPLIGLDDADLTPFSIRDATDDNVEEDLSAMTFSEEDNQPMDLAPLGDEAETVDVDSEPIFEPEISAAPEIEPRQVMESISSVQTVVSDEPEEENAIDDATLNEILDFHAQVEETKPAVPTEVALEPEEVEISEADPTDNIQDVISEPVIEVADAETETVQEPEVVKTEDVADVSANIISNFAKLFAEKKASETSSEPVAAVENVPAQTTVKTTSPSISELVREAVVKQVTQQMEVNFEGYAREAVAAQTQAWLDANLPAIVEAVVSKEIERVMAKVGS